MIKKKLFNNGKKVDFFLKKYFSSQKNTNLISPMKYGVLSGGKKIRSSIIINAGKLFNLKFQELINVCVAVECIHSYSLIHDDLPCMDNDKIRRGKPTTHIKFGESTAVLAGNSLLTLAFETIADKKFKIKNKSKIDLIKNLALCSGHSGIAGGQELDLKYEKKKKNLLNVIDMQKKKTGKLFSFCFYSVGSIADRKISEKRKLGIIGEDIGLLFQIRDDFLDITGKKNTTGKNVNKDNKKGKSTLINLLGYEKTENYANNLKKDIILRLNKYGKKAKDLIEVVEFIYNRKY